MITDIFIKPIEINVNDKTYKLEYDHNAYSKLELKLNKGIFAIMEELTSGNFKIDDYINTAICGLLKLHSDKEIKTKKKEFEKNPYILLKNVPAISAAYIQPLTPPEVLKKLENKKKEMTFCDKMKLSKLVAKFYKVN